MGESSVPVDLFNPGQVFACYGLMDATEVLLGHAEAAFDWRKRSACRFILRTNAPQDPVAVVLDFLASARVRAEAPARSELETSKWDVLTETVPGGHAFPCAEPDSPATLPAILEGQSELLGGSVFKLVIDHWGDSTRRDAVKFWAGAGGYPGAALARDALALVRSRCRESRADPFSLSAEQTSSFRLDWRRDNIPIDLGFNLNEQPRIGVAGYPLVELLAALGLGKARPRRDDKLTYRYSVIGVSADSSEGDPLLDPAILRAGLGGAPLPFPQRRFCMRLGWPGKEGQARAITTVNEESAE